MNARGPLTHVRCFIKAVSDKKGREVCRKEGRKGEREEGKAGEQGMIKEEQRKGREGWKEGRWEWIKRGRDREGYLEQLSGLVPQLIINIINLELSASKQVLFVKPTGK